MTREGRLGFPRPFGDLLSQFRPLIPPKFRDAPSNIAAVATALDEMPQVKNVGLWNGEFYSIDFVLNVRGVDEFSKSSLVFTPEGEFKGGTIRTGTVVFNGEGDRDRLMDKWRRMLVDGANLDMVEDDLSIIMREDRGFGDRPDTLTPHVFFTSRNPIQSSKTSPVSTPELVEIIRRIADSWGPTFQDEQISTRAGMTQTGGGEQETELGDSISGLTDRLGR